MKIQIYNFGPINFFKCDLNKDLHLIVGENNLGKSYATTVIYLIIKSLLESNDGIYILKFLTQEESFLKKIPKNISDLSLQEEIDISDIYRDALAKFLDIFLVRKFQEYFNGTYNSTDSIKSIYTKEELRIVLQFDKTDIELGINDNFFKIKNLNIKKSIKAKRIKQKRKSKEMLDSILIYDNADDSEHFETEFLKSVTSFYTDLIKEITNTIRSIHYLPASRSGLYQALTAFGQIVAQLSKSRSFVSEKIELPAISVPLSDYFLELSEIEINKKYYENNPINKIAEDIEQSILKGKVEFDPKSKKLFYIPIDSKLRLDIRLTSSMASEISPIVSFLRYILTKPVKKHPSLRFSRSFHKESSNSKALIFIEEPEAHLHPINQIKLLDSFAKLLDCNVKLILTSHSNYIFNKLNNLILSKSINIENIEAIILKHTKSGSQGISLPLDEFGIDDENFLDVTEALYEEKVNLIEKVNFNA